MSTIFSHCCFESFATNIAEYILIIRVINAVLVVLGRVTEYAAADFTSQLAKCCMPTHVTN